MTGELFHPFPMLKFALQYESVAQFIREFPEKIATSGVYVKTDKPVELGDQVGLLFKFKTGPETFTGHGEVVWIDRDEEARSGKKGLVIRNIALDDESQRAFNAHLRAHVKVADAPVEEAAVPTVVMTPPRPQPVQAQVILPPHPSAHPLNVALAHRKRWPLITGIALTVIVLAFMGWYFLGGGKAWLANLGVEYRDGQVTRVSSVDGRFFMGLVNQRSSDWEVITDQETIWIGVRGIEELREGDRIGLRYKAQSDGRYLAKQVTVKERIISGTIGGLIDKTKGIFSLEDSKIAGSVVELSSEINAQVRGVVAKLKPGDVVESVYTLGTDGKNMVHQLVVRERTRQGVVGAVDHAGRKFTLIATGDEPEETFAVPLDTQFHGLDWSALAVSDTVKVAYKPEGMLARRVELVAKYVAPPPPPQVKPATPPPPKPKPAPRVLKDVLYNTADNMARFAFVFNRKPEYSGPLRLEGPRRDAVRVPSTTSEFPRSEIFPTTGPIRTVRVEDDGGELTIYLVAAKDTSPRCSFEVEGEKLVAICFK